MGQSSFSGPLMVGGVDVLAQLGINRPAVRGFTGGRTFYVGGSAVTAEAFVKNRDKFATLFGAGGALAGLGGRLNSGDKILIAPGHTESVSAADMGSHTGAASGFSIIGLGDGTMRPAFTWTAAAASWLIDTANVEIANLQLFLAGAHAAGSALTVATPIAVSGVGCKILNCFIRWGFDADQIVGDGISWTATDGVFAYNTAIAPVAAVPSNTFFSVSDASDRLQIIGNTIVGATDAVTRGVVDFNTAASADVQIGFNYLANILASSTKALSTSIDDVTGRIFYNQFRVNSGILATTVATTPFDCEYFQNFTSDAVGLNGALDVGSGTAT